MKRPLAFAGFSMAIALLTLNIVEYKYSKYIFVTAAVLFLASLSVKKIRQAVVAPVVFGAVLFSCLIFMFVCEGTVAEQLKLDNKQAQSVFQITDIGEKTSNGYYSYTVKTKSVDLPGAPQNFKMTLYSRDFVDADYYDYIAGSVSFSKVSNNAFDSYGSYGNSIFLNGYLNSYSSVNDGERPLNYYVLNFRNFIKASIGKCLKKDPGALALALITGDKSNLSDEAYSDFLICGATHVMAVSGLHTSVICMGFYMLLKRFRVEIKLRTVLSLAVLLLYVAVSDFSKSVIRSAVMMTVMLLAKAVSNKADTLNSLGFSVMLLCLNPFAVTDTSTVLTVLSVLGMVSVKPELDSRIKKEDASGVAAALYDAVALTGCVMLTTFPAMWIFFKSFSLVSFVSNIILIPLAQLAMVGTLVMLLLFQILGVGALSVGFTYICTKAMLICTSFFADKLWFLQLDLSSPYYILAYCASLALIGICIILYNNKVKLRLCAAFASLIFLICAVFSVHEASNSTKLYVSSSDAAVIYNSVAAAVINVDDKDNYYDVKRILSVAVPESVLFVNCDYNNDKLALLAPQDKKFIQNTDFYIDLCDGLAVQYKSDEITAYVYENTVTVTENNLTVNGRLPAEASEFTEYEDGDLQLVMYKNKLS